VPSSPVCLKRTSKRDRAWFLNTEENFIVKRFLQKMGFSRNFFSLKIRAHHQDLQDACQYGLSRHPDREGLSSSDMQREGVLKCAPRNIFTPPACSPAETDPGGRGLAFLRLIGYSSPEF